MTAGMAVIGSGPTGVACARALLDAGARVTLLDGGAHADQEMADRYTELGRQEPVAWDPDVVDALRHEYEPRLDDIPLKPVLGSLHPYARDHPARPSPDSGINAVPSMGQGGLSAVWGAAIAPYRDRDLEEWPIGERDLAEHYRAVLKFMPLAGEHDALESVMPLYTDRPQPMAATTQITSLLEDVRAHSERLRRRGIVAGRSRLALQTTDEGPGRSCRGCGLCLHGCPYGSIYRTDLELLRMSEHPRFAYRPGAAVERIEEANDHVILHCGDSSGEARRERFERVFVGAGVLASARLGLMTLQIYDQQIEMQDSAYFTLPLLHLPPAPVATTMSGVTLSQAFIEIDSPDVSSNTVHLQLYGYNDLVLREVARRLRVAPKLLERHGQPLLGRLMLAQGCMHSNSSEPIRVRLEHGDTLDFESPQDDSRTRAEARAACHLLLRAFKDLRTLVLLPLLAVWPAGHSNHFGGTFPMARRPRGVESDLLGRPGGLDRVHFIDASVLPTIPASTITFSVMANAHRIGHEAA